MIAAKKGIPTGNTSLRDISWMELVHAESQCHEEVYETAKHFVVLGKKWFQRGIWLLAAQSYDSAIHLLDEVLSCSDDDDKLRFTIPIHFSYYTALSHLLQNTELQRKYHAVMVDSFSEECEELAENTAENTKEEAEAKAEEAGSTAETAYPVENTKEEAEAEVEAEAEKKVSTDVTEYSVERYFERIEIKTEGDYKSMGGFFASEADIFFRKGLNEESMSLCLRAIHYYKSLPQKKPDDLLTLSYLYFKYFNIAKENSLKNFQRVTNDILPFGMTSMQWMLAYLKKISLSDATKIVGFDPAFNVGYLNLLPDKEMFSKNFMFYFTEIARNLSKTTYFLGKEPFEYLSRLNATLINAGEKKVRLRLEDDWRQQKSEIAVLHDEKDELSTENETLKERIGELAENAELCEYFESESLDLRQKLAQAEEEVAKLKTSSEECEKSRLTISELKLAVEELGKQNEKLQEKNEKLKEEKRDLKVQISDQENHENVGTRKRRYCKFQFFRDAPPSKEPRMEEKNAGDKKSRSPEDFVKDVVAETPPQEGDSFGHKRKPMTPDETAHSGSPKKTKRMHSASVHDSNPKADDEAQKDTQTNPSA